MAPEEFRQCQDPPDLLPAGGHGARGIQVVPGAGDLCSAGPHVAGAIEQAPLPTDALPFALGVTADSIGVPPAAGVLLPLAAGNRLGRFPPRSDRPRKFHAPPLLTRMEDSPGLPIS